MGVIQFIKAQFHLKATKESHLHISEVFLHFKSAYKWSAISLLDQQNDTHMITCTALRLYSMIQLILV
jgi:hypothetical protein